MTAKIQNEWRSTAIFTGMLFMMLGLFTTRAVLSVSVICFFVLSLLHTEHKRQVMIFFRSPILWGMSLLFMIPLVTGLWSEDMSNWQDVVLVKLPLLALPIAFASPFLLNQKQWEILAWVFIGLIAAGTAWSISQYLINMDEINAVYLKAKILDTPLENDHVRFSWITAIAALLAGLLGFRAMKKDKFLCIVLLLISSWLIVYLHILAARTGLMTLYTGLLFSTGLLLYKKRKIAWILLVLMISMPVAAFFMIPAFQNRFKYLRYEFDFVKNADYIPGSTDAVRVISFKAGLSQLQSNPLAGAGFGDINSESKVWYEKNYPSMIEDDRILPSSEYLLYGAGAGVPGLLIFIFVIAVPFFTRTSGKVSWWVLNLTVAFGFLYDIGLEVQYGVFLYCFIVLSAWKRLKPEKI